MTKTVLTFGLISGFVLCLMMVLTIPLHDKIGYDKAMIVGYTTMILAALLVYFGVRSYRDNVNGGIVSFGRAFWVGLMISLIAALMYVVTWQVGKDRIAPGYMEKYQAEMIQKAKASGKPQAEIDKEIAETQKWAEMAKNPLMSMAFTFLEPLPVALLASLISAAMLRRKRREGELVATT